MTRTVGFVRPSPRPEQAREALRTVRDLIRWAVTRMEHAGVFCGHGTDNAWDEASWLVLWSLRLPLERLDPVLDAHLTSAEVDAVVSLVERRCAERMPAAYLTGEAWLRGVRFLCDPRALVPRSPIAELLDSEALEPWLGEDGAVREVLDLCTGAGSLAIFAARRYPQARVTATDVSADALELAAENLALHGLSDRITLRQGDLWAPVPARRYDLIVCNPPYVNMQSMAALPDEYRSEPHAALAGGEDGMDLVRRILEQAASHLSPTGILVLEIGHEIAHFEAAFPRLETLWLPTEGGDHRVALLERSALS